MSEHDESSVELPPSSLSHKELRMLCLDNDLSISGKKSLLIELFLKAIKNGFSIESSFA